MAAPRRSSKPRGQQQADPFDTTQWPLLKAQQALQAAVEPSELAASIHRAQTLLEHGYGALEAWLLSDPTPAERSRMKAPRASSQGQALLDLFD
jgi:hypothetical protein